MNGNEVNIHVHVNVQVNANVNVNVHFNINVEGDVDSNVDDYVQANADFDADGDGDNNYDVNATRGAGKMTVMIIILITTQRRRRKRPAEQRPPPQQQFITNHDNPLTRPCQFPGRITSLIYCWQGTSSGGTSHSRKHFYSEDSLVNDPPVTSLMKCDILFFFYYSQFVVSAFRTANKTRNR